MAEAGGEDAESLHRAGHAEDEVEAWLSVKRHAPLDPDQLRQLHDAALWVLGALGSGVIGNTVYDAMKHLRIRLGARPGGRMVATPENDSIVQALALLCTYRQAAALGYPDEVDDLSVRSVDRTPDATVVVVQGSRFTASVQIPRRNVQLKDVRVTLTGVSPDA